MNAPPLDLVYAGRMSRRFTHPVWGSACPDYLRIMPAQPISRMSLPELADWMHTHKTYHDRQSYVAHCIKASRYPVNDDVFGSLLDSGYDVWDYIGLNNEVRDMQHFTSGANTWKEYDVARLGGSGGWACLTRNRKPVHADEPSVTRTEWLRINASDPDHALYVARDLLWFDVLINGIIHTTVQFCRDFTVETKTVTRRFTAKREVVTLRPKSGGKGFSFERNP